MSEQETSTARRPPQKPQKFRSFAFILYPDCDAHMMVLRLLERFPKIYRAVYILHDKDVYLQCDLDKYVAEHEGELPNWKLGEPKKPHYHVMVTFPSARYVEPVADFLGLNKVEPVQCKESLLQYMIHADIKSNVLGKYSYPLEALEGEQKTISLLTSQNAHFVQLEEILEDMENGAMLTDIVRKINRSPNSKALYEVFEQYQYFICACANQIDRKLSKVYTEKYFDSKTGSVHYA